MEKVLIIGSNSFSGASFADFLLCRGFRVIGISRSAETNNVYLPYKWRNYKNFEFQKLDINYNIPEIANLCNDYKIPYIVNFAAQSMVGESWKNPEDWFKTNVVSTIKLHEELRKMIFLNRYVHVSTPEVYGNCSGFIEENSLFNPSTPYAVSRAAADMSLKTFNIAYKFPVVTTRAANVFGPGQQLYRIIPRTILFILLGRKIQLHGGGISTRSFIHIKDVCDATFKIMQSGVSGETYHISTNEIISIRNLVELICSKLNVAFDDHIEVVGDRLGKDSSYHLSSTKIRSELGWKETQSLDQGIDECISWVKDNLETIKNHPFNYQHKP